MYSVAKELSLHCSNEDEVVDLLLYLQSGTIATIKIIFIRYYKKNVLRIISTVNEDWTMMKDLSFVDIMKSYASYGNFIYKAQLIVMVSEISVLAISGLPMSFQNYSTDNANQSIVHRSLPHGTKCVFVNLSNTMYIFIYIFQVIQCITTGLGNVGTDVFFFLLAMHICGQYDILCENICNIGGSRDYHSLRRRIINFSQKHQHLLKTTADLEETFCLIIMFQVVINISGLSLLGINIFLNIN